MKNSNLLFWAIVALLITQYSVQAQTTPLNIEWDRTLGTASLDGLSCVKQTLDGGYIIGGGSPSGINGDKTQPSQGGGDYWIVKLDAMGNKTWDKTFGGNAYDYISTIEQTSDGGYILGGSSESGMTGDKSGPNKGVIYTPDFWVVKLDLNGNKVWDKTIGTNSDDNLKSLRQTSDGGYILAGHTSAGINGDKTQASKGDRDFWVVKLDGNGNKLWDKSYGGTRGETLYSSLQTLDGGYLFGGYSSSPISSDKSQKPVGASDYWIIKVDATGNKLWDRTFGGTSSDFLTDMQQTSDGGFVLGGFSNSNLSFDKNEPSKGDFDYWILKLDSLGNKVWDRTIGGSKYDQLTSLKQAPDNGFMLGGFSFSGISGDKSQDSLGKGDYWIVKLDSFGTKQWDRTFGGNEVDNLSYLDRCSDGTFILGGSSKTGINGNKSQINLGNLDLWVLKLTSNLLGINKHRDSEIKLYPNPSNGMVNLEMALKQPSQVIVYNALGQCIFTKEVTNNSNANLVNLDLSKEAKGVYTIQVISDNQVYTKKVVLQ